MLLSINENKSRVGTSELTYVYITTISFHYIKRIYVAYETKKFTIDGAYNMEDVEQSHSQHTRDMCHKLKIKIVALSTDKNFLLLH